MTACPKCGATFSGPTIGAHVRYCPNGVTSADLFWLKVNKDAPNGCWVWTGYCQRFGHGWLGTRGLAHRYAWELLVGPVPDGKCVLHDCDNPPCVNPAHLYIGTKLDNSHDAKARDRHSRGERNKRNTLVEAQVLEILRNPPKIGGSKGHPGEIMEYAKRYGVTYGAIYAIVRGASWAHLRKAQS